MSIQHPYQNQRVKVTDGQYAGRTGRVLRVLMDHGAHGFAELEFDEKGKLERDLVPLPFVDRSGVRPC